MLRIISLFLIALLTVSACTEVTQVENRLGADGKPLPRLYRIRDSQTSAIQFRMLDSVNALRSARGHAPVTMNARLNAAAATHSRDMSVQNRPWHFGSDGSSPIDRIRRAGYDGALLGENISETYETEIETLGAWMDKPDTRRVILDKDATDLGFAWYQEENGKIWWTMVMGQAGVSNYTPSPTVELDTVEDDTLTQG